MIQNNSKRTDSNTPLRYSKADREVVYRVIAERRDMRHFLTDKVNPTVLRRILAAAHKAPSVGLMQPWRFIRITDADIRQKTPGQINLN